MTLVAVVMFFVGAIGLIINVTSVMNTTYGFDGAVNTYRRIWDHRWWVVMAKQVGQSIWVLRIDTGNGSSNF